MRVSVKSSKQSKTENTVFTGYLREHGSLHSTAVKSSEERTAKHRTSQIYMHQQWSSAAYVLQHELYDRRLWTVLQLHPTAHRRVQPHQLMMRKCDCTVQQWTWDGSWPCDDCSALSVPVRQTNPNVSFKTTNDGKFRSTKDVSVTTATKTRTV